MTYNAGLGGETRRVRSIGEWIQLAAAIVGLLSALVGGIYGVLSNRAKATAQATAESAHRQADDAQVRIESLERQLASTQAENESLKGSVTDPPAVSPSATPGAKNPADVYHKGTVNLAWGRRIDLDAPPTDPQWGVLVNSGWEVDLGWGYGCDGICFGNGSSDFHNQDDRVVVDSNASKETCTSTTGYSTGNFSIAKVKSGFTFCIVTDKGRVSIVSVVDVKGASEPIKLDITTYSKAGE